jgi:dihydrodipicolinate synthase/N-acetylneuraminate lyase
MPIHEYIYSDHSRLHIRYKLATWIRGLIPHPFMRPPMPAPRRGEAETIFQIIMKTDLSQISRSEFEDTFHKKDAILRTASHLAV